MLPREFVEGCRCLARVPWWLVLTLAIGVIVALAYAWGLEPVDGYGVLIDPLKRRW